jgi:hypothetical protein
MRLLAILVVLACKQCFSHWMWWVELRQYIHHDDVESDVWHTSPQILDLQYWRMAFLAFEGLVHLLAPLLCPTTAMFVRPLILIRKQIKLILYRLAHGISSIRMHYLCGCESLQFESTLG